ncbi:6-phospho-3-hexuloisomerase [Alteribacter natronophilus]|uniref:6-phospho-3-hexuloisomerase n=1 Tax=Alteribacter natronophilus TaxID=2583810 RepID=UPI00110E6816|nr:6-phospho-3-hexuloisomerase [Alteribacter natronophilus]TMW72288.1 6-phospho-3-hexuloisomerase [Alteribacter natronophilus]
MKQTIQTVGNEVQEVLASVNASEAETLSTCLREAPAVFVLGEGRSGLMGKAFAMRLMHGGYRVYAVGETITPSIQKDDLLVAISGSGTTKGIVDMAEKAGKAGAKVFAVTTDADSPLGKQSDHSLVIPAATKYRRETEPDTIQPLGNQFDQSLHLLLDAVIIHSLNSGDAEKTNDELKSRHANLE